MTKPYTGTTDGATTRLRAGTKTFIDCVILLSDRALWNNGDYVNRNMRGKNSLSVHATGRAVDLSYRQIGGKGKTDGRKHAVEWCQILSKHADILGVEMIIDYYPEPYGRAWRCDRANWKKYITPTVSGAPHGDWLHVEISPAMADNPQTVHAAFKQVFGA